MGQPVQVRILSPGSGRPLIRGGTVGGVLVKKSSFWSPSLRRPPPGGGGARVESSPSRRQSRLGVPDSGGGVFCYPVRPEAADPPLRPAGSIPARPYESEVRPEAAAPSIRPAGFIPARPYRSEVRPEAAAGR